MAWDNDRTNSCLDRLGHTCQYKSPPSKSKVQSSKASRMQATLVPRIVILPGVQLQPLPNSELFLPRPRKFSTVQIDLPVTHDVLHILNPSVIQTTQAVYFRSFHPGLPILSKRLLHADLSNSVTEPRADPALLLLRIKLFTDLPDSASTDGMRTPAYLAVKAQSVCGGPSNQPSGTPHDFFKLVF